ncbi:MAG: hypothetical protein LBH29_04565, partial [Elusimicrobiota bacterium]|nr:hypothetical protein [Elusimicrobiota bacterium]
MIKKIISEKLQNIISDYALSKNLKEEISFSVEIPPKNIDADFALNAVMPIAKQLKAKPQDISAEIIEAILKEMPGIVEKAVAAGPFIN